MTFWQKIILFLILGLSTMHLLRDVLQDLKIQNVLANVWNKPQPASNVYSYVIETVLIILVVSSFVKGEFGFMGYAAATVLVLSIIAWLIYYLN